MPTLIAKYYVAQTGAQGTGALTTPSFTPSNGEVIVIGYETWDTGTSIGAPTDSLGVHQTYASRIILAPGGFNPWVAKYTAVISGSPGSMTISSGVPSASARYSMVVERWGSATLAATPVTAGANGTTGAAVVSITPTSGTSVISWSGGDSQSLDPATRAYLGSGTDEGTRDDHVGSNGVGYHGYQASTGTSAQNVGLSAPIGMKFGIVAIEILSSGAVQAPAVQPLVVAAPVPPPAGQQTLLRNAVALTALSAKGSTPIVVAQPGPVPAAAALLRRGALVDPPVLTTPRPIVVTAAAAASAFSAAILLTAGTAPAAPATATPQPYVVTAPQPTSFSAPILIRSPAAQPPGVQPVVVTAPAPAPNSAPILLRGSLTDPPVLTTASPTVITAATSPPAAAAILVRNPQAPAAAAATATPAPIVVTAAAIARPGQPLLLRGTLADPPILTTRPPLVVTTPPARLTATPILIRSPQPPVVQSATPGPLVITRPAQTARGAVILVAAPQAPAAPTGTSSPTPELVTRSGGLDLTTGGPSRNLITRTAGRNLVTRTTSRDLEV